MTAHPAAPGLRIRYERRGSGSPLLLIHGIGHHWRAWEPVLDHLAAHHDVLAIDLPGFGRSPVPAGGMPTHMGESARALAEFCRDIGWRRPHVAGNSLGGALALELAARDLVSSATALAPAGFWHRWELAWALGLLRTLRATTMLPDALVGAVLRRRRLRAASFAMLMARPGLIDAERAFADTMALRNGQGFAAIARQGPRYRFTGVPTAPVTVAWGDRDRVLLPRQAHRARLMLPHARHVTLPRCGHVPMSDDPDMVAQVILEGTGAILAHDGSR